MSGPDIFISYCRQDRASARLFAEALIEEGFGVWWDAVMHSGETFDEVIERNLRASKAVVVLWSPRSVASRWVRAEATQADRANKLVPVIIESCERPIIFELTHTADMPDWKGDRDDSNWRSLVNDLRRLVGPAKEKALSEETAAEASQKPMPVEAAPVEKPAVAKLEPESPAEKAAADKAEMAAKDEELERALERLAAKASSALRDPTPAEEDQANFFKHSDEFRQTEGENVHCLRRVHAIDSDVVHVVGPSGLRIGRVAPADIIVSEPSVSREHCVIELAADKLRVMDLNSTNGTYIDNRRIGRAEILPVGSTLRVGNVSFEHEIRSRTEVEQLGSAAGFALGAVPREPRIARSS